MDEIKSTALVGYWHVLACYLNAKQTLSANLMVLLLNSSGCLTFVPSSVWCEVACSTSVSTCFRGVCDLCELSANRPRHGPIATMIGQCQLPGIVLVHHAGTCFSPPITSECGQAYSTCIRNDTACREAGPRGEGGSWCTCVCVVYPACTCIACMYRSRYRYYTALWPAATGTLAQW